MRCNDEKNNRMDGHIAGAAVTFAKHHSGSRVYFGLFSIIRGVGVGLVFGTQRQ